MYNWILSFFTNNTGEIEINKILVTVIGTLVGTFMTALASIVVTIYSSNRMKKTTYINVITSNRILWMEDIRNLINEFICMTKFNFYDTVNTDTKQVSNYFKKLAELRNSIFLKLNYCGYIDKEIILTVNEIFYKVEEIYEFLNYMKNISNPKEYIKNAYMIEIYEEFVRTTRSNYVKTNSKLHSNKSEEFEKIVKKYEKKFLLKKFFSPDKLLKEIAKNHNKLIKLVQIYLKLEWERVKKESEGKLKFNDKSNDKEYVKKMLTKYNIEVLDYSRNKSDLSKRFKV